MFVHFCYARLILHEKHLLKCSKTKIKMVSQENSSILYTYLDICLTYTKNKKKWKTRWNLKQFFQQNLNFFSVTNFSPKGNARHLFVQTKNKVLHVTKNIYLLLLAFHLKFRTPLPWLNDAKVFFLDFLCDVSYLISSWRGIIFLSTFYSSKII